MENIRKDEKNNSEKVKPFQVIISHAKNEETRIKPFTIGEEPQTSKRDSTQEVVAVVEKESEMDGGAKRTKPFDYVTEEIAQIAENLCHPLYESMDDLDGILPHIAQALMNYKKAGNVIPSLINKGAIMAIRNLNFDLKLNRTIIKIYDTELGEKPEYEYSIGITVFTANGKSRYFETVVNGSKVKETVWLKKATNSLATIPKDKNEKAAFHQKVQQCIETEDVPEEIIYPNAGWRQVPGRGWRYIHGDGVVGEPSSFIHTIEGKYVLDINENCLGVAQTFYEIMKMRHICKNSMASTELLLYLHTTLLTELFEQAGHPLKFVFVLSGVTNSRKTSLVLALAKIFNRERMVADAEFATATSCGIEKTLSLYKDSPVLIDDFKPGVTQAEQREMDRKLDNLIRCYGDKVTKKRMLDFTADADKKFFPARNGCILTAEIITGIPSSISKVFITEIGKDDVLNERLQFCQNNRWVIPTHVYDFLVWVTRRFDEIVQYIFINFPQFRNQYIFEYPRYGEIYATFMTTAVLISNYSQERGFWSEKESEAFIRQIEDIVVAELRGMEERIKKRDHVTVVLEAFMKAIESSEIVPLKLNCESCVRRHTLYEDDEYYYIQTKELWRITNNYCRQNYKSFSISNEDAMIGLLERRQILDVLEKEKGRERSRKLPIQHGNTQRYLFLKKEAIRKLEE